MTAYPSIDDLVPHRRSMRLLDEVVEFDGDSKTIVCGSLVRSSPMARGDCVRAVVALEYMAQAAAACTGMLDRGSDAPGAARGFLVGVPSMTLETESFAMGEALRVSATRLSAAGDTASFQCTVARRGAVVASARLLVVKESN